METKNTSIRQTTSNGVANQSDSESKNTGVSLTPPIYQFDNGSANNSAVVPQLGNAETEGQTSATETWDRHTNRRIAGIHPSVQASAHSFVNQVQAQLGIMLRVTAGLRSFNEQDELYEQGRTTPGGVVTNAKGGQSYHNYGLAIDVVEITDEGQANWDTNWSAIGAVGESLGWEWGGNWTSIVDKPHFQMAFGLSTSQLRSMYTAQGGNFVNLDGRAPIIPESSQENALSNQDNTQTELVAPGVAQISGSVGEGGENQFDDVKLVQTMLNNSGASLEVDGDAGPLTIAAINAFQMAQFSWKDGRVDVNGKTWNKLESTSTPVALVHTVKKGDNLSGIASQFNTSVAALLSVNPSITNPNSISIGQKITIPTAVGKTAGPSLENQTPVQENNAEGRNSTEADEGGSTEIIYGSQVTNEFSQKVIQISGELGLNPNYLMAAMAFETGGSFDPAQKNFAGSGATGLIQFMPKTAEGLGTSTADLANMSAIEQLDYVKAYFMPYTGKLNTLEDLYMAILWPRAIGQPNSYVLWSQGTKAYELNSGLDSNRDRSVTKGEAAGKVKEKYEAGLEDVVTIGGVENTQETTTTEGSVNSGGESENSEVGGESATSQAETSAGSAAPTSSNFAISEFHCNDGTPVPEEFYSNLQDLMSNLEVLRAELDGNSIKINSGYRSPAYNDSVGGASNSQHKYAKAADIVVSGYSPSLVHTTIARLIREGKMKQGGLGKYNTFTHYDVRGTQARW